MCKNKSLSILIVIPSLMGGGAERVAITLAEHWLHKGYKVILLTQSTKDSDVYEVASGIIRICTQQLGQTGPWAQFKKVWVIRKIIKQYQPDIVLGIMMSSSVLSILAGMGLPTKVIATEHAHPPSQKLSSLWIKLREWTYPKAAKVIALTQMSAQWLHDNVPGSDVCVIQNAVQWPLKNVSPIVAIDKKTSRKLLLAVGRLHQEKGFDILLKSFALIHAQYPDWDLVILGEGNERKALNKLCVDLKLSTRVSMPGRVGNLKDWYEAADLFVLSSHNEGLSNSLQEAMASGLCVVSFDCDTGPREIIREQVDGVLVRPTASAEALARHLSTLMGNEALRKQYAEQAPSVLERFSMQKIGKEWDDLFQLLITKE